MGRYTYKEPTLERAKKLLAKGKDPFSDALYQMAKRDRIKREMADGTYEKWLANKRRKKIRKALRKTLIWLWIGLFILCFIMCMYLDNQHLV